jgi:RNA-binding protein
VRAAEDYPPAPALTGAQRRHLRALGHHLNPLVMLGKNGLTEAFLAQANQALADHELMKVKVLEACELTVDDAAPLLAERLHAAVAQTIGRLVLIYRPDPEDTRIHFPKASRK